MGVAYMLAGVEGKTVDWRVPGHPDAVLWVAPTLRFLAMSLAAVGVAEVAAWVLENPIGRVFEGQNAQDGDHELFLDPCNITGTIFKAQA